MGRKIWSILGNSQRLDGGAMFGNAPRSMWERWVAPDERNRILLACRTMLIEEANGLLILFETGIGAFFPPELRDRYGIQESHHLLLENLEAAGFSHNHIDIVVLSHLHFDHAGGLLQAWSEGKAPALCFPKAKFIVSKSAWERANHPHPRDRASFIPELQGLLTESGRLELIESESSTALGPDYRFHFSDGHTPGLLISEVATHDGPIAFPSDLIPGQPWVHVPITMGYDRYPELLIEEKRSLLTDLVSRSGRLFFTHDSEAAMAQITFDSAKNRFASEKTWASLIAEPV